MSSRPSHTPPLVAALLSALVLGAAPAPAETQRVPKYIVNPEQPFATACRALHFPVSPVTKIVAYANRPSPSTLDRLVRGRQAVRGALGSTMTLDALVDALEGKRLEVPFPSQMNRLAAVVSNPARRALRLAYAINYAAFGEEHLREVARIPHAAHPDAVGLVVEKLSRNSGHTPDERALRVVLALLHDLFEDAVHRDARSLPAHPEVLQIVEPGVVPVGLSLSERLVRSTAAARSALNEAFSGLRIPGAGGVGDAVVYLTEPPSPHGFAGYADVPRGFPGSKHLRRRMTRSAFFRELILSGGACVADVKRCDAGVNADRTHALREDDSRGLPRKQRVLNDLATRSFLGAELAKVHGTTGAITSAVDDTITAVMNSPAIVEVAGPDRWCEFCRLQQWTARFAENNRPLIKEHIKRYLDELAGYP